MKSQFATYVRQRRQVLREEHAEYSVRKVAGRVGVEPSYLSKVERGETPPPSDEKIVRLAADLGEDPDILLALAGKIPKDVKNILCSRPGIFTHLLRELQYLNDDELVNVIKQHAPELRHHAIPEQIL